MDDESPAADEFTSNSAFGPLESGWHSSGMFSGAQNLTVSGQTLTNITNYTTPVVPSDFRTVPLGDIDLQREIRFNNSTSIVDRQYERQGVRRLYSARLGGQNTTVAIYQGPGAEEDGDKISEIYDGSPPKSFQICGVANYGNNDTLFTFRDSVLVEYALWIRRSSGRSAWTWPSQIIPSFRPLPGETGNIFLDAPNTDAEIMDL
ncbi:hypothetical protein B0H19DRAFT_1376865 [Mycena capillaripes]|nr:hypothetical protein B0H19DRAFT_1376865 [Mycena capillaripes]